MGSAVSRTGWEHVPKFRPCQGDGRRFESGRPLQSAWSRRDRRDHRSAECLPVVEFRREGEKVVVYESGFARQAGRDFVIADITK